MQFDVAHDQLLQQLLAELFDQNQLRQFVHDWVGGSITRQLPGDVVSHETLVHGVVVVLRRNGLLDHNLFRELLRVRPGQHALIAGVAERCGVGGLEAPATSTALVAPSVRTPDYVVQQTYESMRRQRDILREFVNHFAPTRILLALQGSRSTDTFFASVQDWLGTRAAEITYPAVRGAVHGIGLAIVGLSARDEGLRAVSTFAVILFGQQIEAHLRTIGWFAGLSEAELYELVLRDLTHRP